MIFSVIPILLLATAQAQKRSIDLHNLPKFAAATPKQVKYALENEYPDTGPGSKYYGKAYKVLKSLDDALIAYLDDPDTKLPQYERSKATALLIAKNKIAKHQNPLYLSSGNQLFDQGYENSLTLQHQRQEPFRVYKEQQASPLNIGHYKRVQEKNNYVSPQYSFSYGVHDKLTGDSKSAHESRDGEVVTGFYTFMDADGKQRTVHYTADDKQGFRAIVRRTLSNSH